MRKLLLSLLLILVVLLAGFLITGKIEIGSFKIMGVKDIKEESEQLDKELEELVVATSVTFPKKESDQQSAIRALNISKTTYEEKARYSTESEINLATKHEIYEIESLWVKIGNYATKEGLKLKMEPTAGSTGAKNSYDLRFTATGKYMGIADFITSLEEDEKLEFIIEEFNLVPGADEMNLIGTFLVRDITINVGNIKQSVPAIESSATNATTGNTNTTNTNTAQ